MRGIHRRPVNSPHKGPVTRKMFPFDDVIMIYITNKDNVIPWHGHVFHITGPSWGNPLRDDVIKWKHFPRYWPFVKGIRRSSMNSPHKSQWRGASVFSLICAWANDGANNRDDGNLRPHGAYNGVTLMRHWWITADTIWKMKNLS